VVGKTGVVALLNTLLASVQVDMSYAVKTPVMSMVLPLSELTMDDATKQPAGDMALVESAAPDGRVTAVTAEVEEYDTASVEELTAFSRIVTDTFGRMYLLNPLCPDTLQLSWLRPTNFHPSAAGIARLNSMTVFCGESLSGALLMYRGGP
jgi:hypothetical protein